MKKSKIVLLYSLVIIVTILYVFIVTNNKLYKTYYSKNTKIVMGSVLNYQIDGNQLKLEVKAKEKLLVNYYLKSKDEFSNLKLGDYIKVEGDFNIPSVNRNFNTFNYQNYLLSKKIYWTVNAVKIEKIKDNDSFLYNVKNKIITKISKSKNSDYLKTFILGDTSSIENDVLNSYQANGISHLLAISGMHITLLSTIILLVLNKLNKNESINYIITILFLIFYMFLTNFSPSVIRSCFLFILLTINKTFKLKINTINILILICVMLCLYNPYYIYNLGFKFSFIISFFLILASNIISKYQSYLVKTFVISLISFIASIPILINNFYSINLLSPILNVLFVPLVSIIIFPLALITFFIPSLDFILTLFLKIMEMLSLLMVKFSLNLIMAKPLFIVIIVYYVLIFLGLKYRRVYLYILVLLLFINYNINLFNFDYKITMIDVGQGDSILLELPHGKNILIDTGGKVSYQKEKWMEKSKETSLSDYNIIPYLKSQGIKKIDYLIISHGDMDHAGEAINIIDKYKVLNVFMNSADNTNVEDKIIDVLKDKKIFYKQIDKYKLKIDKDVLNFINSKTKDNENEDSLIIYTKLNKKNILLMADGGMESENKIISEYNLPKVDILKVGHHGSKYSTGLFFVEKIRPKLALISVGLNNRYNHPHKESLLNLKKYNAYTLMTSERGMIKVILNDKLKVVTCL